MSKKSLANKIIISFSAIVMSAILYWLCVYSYGWFFSGWQSGNSRVSFTASETFIPKMAMWTYNTDNEVASCNLNNNNWEASRYGVEKAAALGGKGWKLKYSDEGRVDLGEELEEDKHTPTCVKTIDDSSATFCDDVRLQFGAIENIAENSDQNSVYYRFTLDPGASGNHELKMAYNLPEGYVKVYGENGAAVSIEGLDAKADYPFINASYVLSKTKCDAGTAAMDNLFEDASALGASNTKTYELSNSSDVWYLYVRFNLDVETVYRAMTENSALVQSMPFHMLFDVDFSFETHLVPSGN